MQSAKFFEIDDWSKIVKWGTLISHLTFYTKTLDDAISIHEIFQTTNSIYYQTPTAVLKVIDIETIPVLYKYRFDVHDMLNLNVRKQLKKLVERFPETVQTMMIWANKPDDMNVELYDSICQFGDYLLSKEKDGINLIHDKYLCYKPYHGKYATKYSGRSIIWELDRDHLINGYESIKNSNENDAVILLGLNNRRQLIPTSCIFEDAMLHFDKHLKYQYKWYNYITTMNEKLAAINDNEKRELFKSIYLEEIDNLNNLMFGTE